MPRIRSIHPSFFTDEACVSCSPIARLLYIGLWTEADDQGVFVWRPLQMKMRLFPADNVDVPALLAELSAANLVTKFTHKGADFGAIRNFRRHQRPKTPNATHFLPEDFRTYVGLSDGVSETEATQGPAISEIEPDEVAPFPPEAEKSPQMEDGGEKGREGEERKGGGRGARAARLPPDWLPSEIDRAFALKQGLTAPSVERIAEKFRNYWTAKSGAAAAKLDWPATWRNWVLEEAERRGIAPGQTAADKALRSNIQ